MKPEDHTKIEVNPILEVNRLNKKDWMIGFKVKIPLDKISYFFKKLFGKK